MASFLILNSAWLTLPIRSACMRAPFKPLHVPMSPPIRIVGDNQRRRRGLAVITRAGPNTATYVLAFVFPLSMLIGTIIASIRIADKLDRDYLEELSINEAIREAEDDDDDDDDGISISLDDEEQQPALQGRRTRNRPKREV